MFVSGKLYLSALKFSHMVAKLGRCCGFPLHADSISVRIAEGTVLGKDGRPP